MLDPIYITNIEGKIEFVNDAFVKTFGYERDEVIHKYNPTIPDWLVEETKELYEQALRGNSLTDLHLIRQKVDGELLDLSVTFSPIYDDHQVRFLELQVLQETLQIIRKEI